MVDSDRPTGQTESRREQLEALRREIQIGLHDIETGNVAPLDMAAIRARARREFEADSRQAEA